MLLASPPRPYTSSCLCAWARKQLYLLRICCKTRTSHRVALSSKREHINYGAILHKDVLQTMTTRRLLLHSNMSASSVTMTSVYKCVIHNAEWTYLVPDCWLLHTSTLRASKSLRSFSLLLFLSTFPALIRFCCYSSYFCTSWRRNCECKILPHSQVLLSSQNYLSFFKM